MVENRKNEFLGRAYLVFALLFLFGLAIIGKVVHTQVWEGQKWRNVADSLYVRSVAVEAERGSILSESGTILATSTVSYELRVDLKTASMQDKSFDLLVDSLGYYISTVLDNTKSPGAWVKKLRQARNKGDRYFLLAKKVNFQHVQQAKEFPLFREGKYKGGLIIIPHQERSRPFGDLARRTIGAYKVDHVDYGLEGKYQEELAGEKGYWLMEHLPGGFKKPVNDLTEIAPKPGNDIVTTLDVGMQDMAHFSLQKALTHHKAESGVAVVMEIKTGNIRAMVNLDRNGEIYSEQFNHAIGSAVEPGSIFKLASMMALLEDGYVEPDDLVDLEKGKTTFYDRELQDAHIHGIDTVTVQKAFEMSSNVGITKLIQRYYGAQPNAFISKLESYGMTGQVGIDLEGEAKPLIKRPDMGRGQWSGITLPWMSMGYELKVTPIQLLALYAAIANDGKMMRPRLVTEIQKYGLPIRKIQPTVLSNRVTSRKTLKQIKAMLEGVVERGTAQAHKSKQYRFAGKTGTARIRDKKTEEVTYRSSFVGYFPVEEPLYACIVMISGSSQFGYYGNEVALPVFRQIADYCFQSRKEMFPEWKKEGMASATEAKVPQWEAGFRHDFSKVCREAEVRCEHSSDSNWTVTEVGSHDKLQLSNRFCPKNQVPNVVGMGLRDALYVLENAGLKVDPFGLGKVRRQSVSAGANAQGQYIRIYLE